MRMLRDSALAICTSWRCAGAEIAHDAIRGRKLQIELGGENAASSSRIWRASCSSTPPRTCLMAEEDVVARPRAPAPGRLPGRSCRCRAGGRAPGSSASNVSPPISMSPASGLCAPVSTRIRVDLPAPFSPIRQWISPGQQIEIDAVAAPARPERSWRCPASRSGGEARYAASRWGVADVACDRMRPAGAAQCNAYRPQFSSGRRE